MKKRLLFWFFLLLFILHQWSQKILGLHFPFFDSYLDPFLSMPIIWFIWQWERQRLLGISGPIPVVELLLGTLFWILFFEIGFPLIRSAFVGDWWDVPAYLLGTAVFYLINEFWGTDTVS